MSKISSITISAVAALMLSATAVRANDPSPAELSAIHAFSMCLAPHALAGEDTPAQYCVQQWDAVMAECNREADAAGPAGSWASVYITAGCMDGLAAAARKAQEIAAAHARPPSTVPVPFPTWDVRAIAERETASEWSGLADAAAKGQLTADENETLQRGREAFFQKTLTLETNSRNYLAAHWSEFPPHGAANITDVANSYDCIGLASRGRTRDPGSWFILQTCLAPQYEHDGWRWSKEKGVY